jgi:hypothetical protein
MRSWLLVGAVVGSVAAVASGCSGNNGPGSYTDFCTQEATAECGFVTGVCTELTSSTCQGFVYDACVTAAETAMEDDYRTYNASNVAACMSQITTAYQVLVIGMNESLSYSSISGPPGDQSTVDYQCAQVFTGNQGMGATCRDDYDCSGSLVCTPVAPGGTDLECAPLTTVPDGQPCQNPGDVCVTGDTCQKQFNGGYQCATATSVTSGMGAACGGKTDPPCATSLFCDTANGSTCQAAYQFGLGFDCEYYGGAAPSK